MKKQNNIPELRFPSFNNEWQIIKGDEIFDSISNKNHNSELPILAITQEHGAIPRELIAYNISVTDKSIESYKVVEQGDFIISLRSFQGGIEFSNYKGICSPAYIILKPIKEIDSAFFKYYFKTPRYIKRLTKNLEGIRDGKMISFKYFSDAKLTFPCLPEQKRIASFFKVLDKKIAELKQKKNLLEQYKKGVMQKLFSQEFRFKDKNGKEFPKWEKKVLGNVAEVKRGAASQHLKYVNDKSEGIRLLRINDFLSDDAVYIQDTVEIKRFRVKTNDLLIAGTGATAGIIFIVPEKFNDMSFSYNAPRIRVTHAYHTFIYYYLKSDIILKEQRRLFVGNAQPFLDTDSMRGLRINLPSLTEQIKIANFLVTLDEKINNTENQIQQTMQYKKGLLQKMFI